MTSSSHQHDFSEQVAETSYAHNNNSAKKQPARINGIFAAIIALACFFPTGIAAIIFAYKANSDSGYIGGRDRNGKRARCFTIWSISIGLTGFISAMGVWIFFVILRAQKEVIVVP